MTTQLPDAAHVVVVRGAPDEHELAALVAGLAAVAAASSDEQAAGGAWQDATPTPWSDRRRTLARPLAAPLPARRGPDAWRWSLHP
jgi:hypothetical protein